jgi:Putative transposase
MKESRSSRRLCHVANRVSGRRAKLLPVEYFMVTFTLPRELRPLAWRHQTRVYNLLFDTATRTLKDFGLNRSFLGAELAITAVLHTHSRRLDFHPHLHVIVPGGGIHQARRQWFKVKDQYLFNEQALSTVFRARFLQALNDNRFNIPYAMPSNWVVDVKPVGRGEPALKYLSAYLYRGVISEKNILANQNGRVTFNYLEARTGITKIRTLPGADFLWLIFQNVLPKGFRRVRDYGFLHGNAKAKLALVRYALRVVVKELAPTMRPHFKCPKCQAPMRILAFTKPRWLTG